MKKKVIWLLLLLGMLYFYRPLFMGDTFFFRDLGYDFVPQKQLFAQMIQEGTFPVWDEYRHGGQPYLADLNNSALYPTNLLYLLFPFFKAFSINIVIHAICALVAAFWCARVLGFCPSASGITAILYGFCGYSLSLINLHGRFLAIALIPLLFVGWHRYLLEKISTRWLVFSVLIGVCQVLAGAPEVNVLTLVLLAGWSLFYPYPQRSLFQKTCSWILLSVWILGLSSIQLIPTLEMSLLSARGDGIDYTTFSQWSLYPGRLAELFIPEFFGSADTLPFNVHYWGGNLGDSGYPYILNIYFGCMAILFAGLSGLSGIQCHCLPRRTRRFLFTVFVVSLLLSLGRYLPFFPLLHHIPLMTLFRYPIKFLIAGLFPLALLSGHCAHLYATSASGRETLGKILRSGMLLFSGMAVVLGLCTMLFYVSATFGQRFQEVFFQNVLGEVAQNSLKMSFFHATAVCLAVSLLFYARRVKKASWQPWILVCLFTIELLSAGRRINFYAPERFFRHTPALVGPVREALEGGRLFRAKDPLPAMIYVDRDDIMDAPPDHVLWLYRWKFEVLSKYLAAYYNIPVIFHKDYDLLAQKYLVKLTRFIENISWDERVALLSAGNVTAILSAETFSLPGVERLESFQSRGKVPFTLYKNHRAMGKAALVTAWKDASSDEEALSLMRLKNYDPRSHAIIQAPERTVFDASFLRRDVKPQPVVVSAGTCQASTKPVIDVVEVSLLSQQYAVSHACGGYLVLSDPWYPGWRVEVDGRQQLVMRANLAFSAVYVEAGTHHVSRQFFPYSLVFGAILSLAFGIVGLCLIQVITVKRGRKRSDSISG